MSGLTKITIEAPKTTDGSLLKRESSLADGGTLAATLTGLSPRQKKVRSEPQHQGMLTHD